MDAKTVNEMCRKAFQEEDGYQGLPLAGPIWLAFRDGFHAGLYAHLDQAQTSTKSHCSAVLKVIEQGATPDKSYTTREIGKSYRGWRALSEDDQSYILQRLVADGSILEITRKGSRGPATKAWLARTFAPEVV